MAHIVDRVSTSFDELGKIRQKVLMENEPASYGLIKENVMCRITAEATREQRLQIGNAMMAVNEDHSMVIGDSVAMVEDMEANLRIVDFFSVCTSVICFVLGLF